MLGVKPIPSNEFCKKLYLFDPDLRVVWDEGMGVWQIWHENNVTKELSHVMNVMEDNGMYRPLDDRVFPVLIRNMWYAQHPDETQKDFVDVFIDKIEKEHQTTMDNLKHISQDVALKKRFEKARELAGSVGKNEWTTARTFLGADGKPLRNANDVEIQYVPHKSLINE